MAMRKRERAPRKDSTIEVVVAIKLGSSVFAKV